MYDVLIVRAFSSGHKLKLSCKITFLQERLFIFQTRHGSTLIACSEFRYQLKGKWGKEKVHITHLNIYILLIYALYNPTFYKPQIRKLFTNSVVQNPPRFSLTWKWLLHSNATVPCSYSFVNFLITSTE